MRSFADGTSSICPSVNSVTMLAEGNSRSQPSGGSFAANSATLAKAAESSKKPTGKILTAPIRLATRARELKRDDQHRGQHKQWAQIFLAASGALDLHRQRQVELVIAQQPRAVGDDKGDESRLTKCCPPGLYSERTLAMAGSRQAEEEHRERDDKHAGTSQRNLTKAKPRQHGTRNRAQHRAQFPANGKERKPLCAAPFTFCLTLCSRFRQQRFNGGREERAADAGQTRPENNRPQRLPEGQQQITRYADDAAAQDNDFRAVAVRQCAANDKHPLLRKRAQTKHQPDQPAGEQQVIAQEYRQEGHNGIKANVENKLAAQQNGRPEGGGRAQWHAVYSALHNKVNVLFTMVRRDLNFGFHSENVP